MAIAQHHPKTSKPTQQYPAPLPTPSKQSPIKLLLLAAIRPFYAAKRADQLPYLAVLFLIVISTAITVYVGFVFAIYPDEYIRQTTEPSILSFIAYSPKLFVKSVAAALPPFADLPIYTYCIIPIVVSVQIYLAHLLLAAFFAPHVSTPQQPFIQAWKLAHHKLATLYPALALVVCLTIFFVNYPYIEYQQHISKWNQPTPRHKYEKQINFLQQQSANSSGNMQRVLHEKLYKLYEEQAEYQIEYNQLKQAHLDKGSILVRYRLLISYAVIPFSCLFPLFILIHGMTNPFVRLRSPWPAFCEKCGYNIFSSNRHQSHVAINCTECGSLISSSLPPIHRIDVPFANSTLRHPIRFLMSHFLTAALPLIAFKRFIRTIQIYSIANTHRRFAFTAMLIMILTCTATINVYCYFTYVHEGIGKYSSSTIRHILITENLVSLFFLPQVFLALMILLPVIFWAIFRFFTKQHLAYASVRISAYLLGTLTYLLLPLPPIYAWLLWENENPYFLQYLAHGNRYIYLWHMAIEKTTILPMCLAIYGIVMCVHILYLHIKAINTVRFANA